MGKIFIQRNLWRFKTIVPNNCNEGKTKKNIKRVPGLPFETMIAQSGSFLQN